MIAPYKLVTEILGHCIQDLPHIDFTLTTTWFRFWNQLALEIHIVRGHACLIETDINLYEIMQAKNFLTNSENLFV